MSFVFELQRTSASWKWRQWRSQTKNFGV